jgi:hypothetical protein
MHFNRTHNLWLHVLPLVCPIQLARSFRLAPAISPNTAPLQHGARLCSLLIAHSHGARLHTPFAPQLAWLTLHRRPLSITHVLLFARYLSIAHVCVSCYYTRITVCGALQGRPGRPCHRVWHWQHGRHLLHVHWAPKGTQHKGVCV